ncbi:MAG: FKBP-type peptidyl-prolyl cis-trans isomerase [Bacteroidales bacterium]|nr:FKBP-type peptidyl-prolyl cis-trans isomerase [Bacteroidales bacterium]
MKTSILIITALLISFCLSAQEVSQQTEANQQKFGLTDQADTLQYAIGAFIGQWMVKNDFKVQNANLFLKGMDDVLQKRSLAVTDSTIAPIVSAYQLSTKNEKSRQMEEQLFASLKGKAGVGVLPNGVHYMVKEQGSGIRPTVKDTVVINAIGVFPDGTLFEDTYQKKKPITIITGNLIPGLNETIQLMPEGSVWRIFIPSVLAYGSAGLTNVIPPNTALVFDITLMEVKK